MPADLSRRELSDIAGQCDLTVVGVASPEPFKRELEYVVDHIHDGYTRGMDWFTVDRAHQSANPRTLHDSLKSIISVGVPFWNGHQSAPEDGVLRGRIARYAWGRDYHKVLRRRMQKFATCLSEAVGREIEARTLSDTARAFDRAIASRSGTGWFGKNSMIIVPGHGSWVMLGELYVDIELIADVPLDQNCGRCSICIDRCPTGAISAPYRIDAPRCISYLTIEERGVIPREYRPLMGNWVFGCDVCQDVCPYTGAARQIDDPDFQPATVDNAFPSLALLATMDHHRYVEVFGGTAVTRAKRRGLARNAAIALGNSADERAEQILRDLCLHHEESLVRGHAIWAISHLLEEESHALLQNVISNDPSDFVQGEVRAALGEFPETGVTPGHQ